MIKLLASALSLIFSILMIVAMLWFEVEEKKIIEINREHRSNIEQLQKIDKINVWLDEVVKPLLIALPKTQEEANSNLVQFFDKNQKRYNFSVNNYINRDDIAIYLLNNYTVKRSDLSAIESLLNIHYPLGFLEFQELIVDKKSVSGKVLLIQPFYGEMNVSKL